MKGFVKKNTIHAMSVLLVLIAMLTVMCVFDGGNGSIEARVHAASAGEEATTVTATNVAGKASDDISASGTVTVADGDPAQPPEPSPAPEPAVTTAPACQHVWSDWEQTAAATVFKEGRMTHSCIICGISENQPVKKIKPFVRFAKKKYSLKPGKKLTIKLKYAKGDKVMKWVSSEKSRATVDKKGVVTAKAVGKARITAIMKSGKKASCLVHVSRPAAKKKSSAAAAASRSSGGGTVYWTPSGSVYHYSRNCSTLSRSRTVYSGSVNDSGKSRACKVCS